MESQNRLILYLKDSDILDGSIDKDLNDFTWNDFENVTQEMINTAWFIEYTGKKGFLVLKNKSTVPAGYTNKF